MHLIRMPARKAAIASLLALALLLTVMIVPTAPVSGATLTDSEMEELAEKYAPTLHFHSGEELYPVDVEYFISNSNLNESVGGTGVLISSNPTASSLGDYSSTSRSFYLDNRLGTINDRRIIDEYKKSEATLGYTVYSHVTANASRIAIQYWFFYVFNEGTYNSHEGDWEMIEVILDTDLNPVSVAYSQHEQGQKATWSQVEKDGDSPAAYVAKGSHANYFRSYQGKMGAAQDLVDGNGKVLRPGDYELKVLGEKGAGEHSASQNWIDYSGRWGDWGDQTSEALGQRGPLGPGYRMDGEMWAGLSWADSRDALDDNQLLLELLLSYLPLILIVLLIVPIALMVRRVLKKRKSGELRAPYIYLLDIRGADLRSIGNLLAVIGLALGLVAAFLPFYEASVNINSDQFSTDGFERVLLVDGISGVQINSFDESQGIVQVGALPFPFWVLIVVGLVAFIISTVAREPRKAGRKYISRGVGLMVPLVLLVIVVGSLSGIVGSFGGSGESGPMEDVLKALSSDPMGGEKVVYSSVTESVTLRWGVGLGASLMMVAGALLVAGGVMQYASRKAERNERSAEAQPVPASQPSPSSPPAEVNEAPTPSAGQPEVAPPAEPASEGIAAEKEGGKVGP